MKNAPVLPCSAAEILLPNPRVDYRKWAVVACDQFTSDPGYWDNMETETAGAESALRLILPECRLGSASERSAVAEITRTMDRYLSRGVFCAHDGYVLTERTTAYGNRREGLVLQIDLEEYDYRPGSVTPIRASEGTVAERIPPRVKIREACSLELPHVVVLTDDVHDAVLSAARAAAKETLYDFDLLGGGGHLRGRLIPRADGVGIRRALSGLLEESAGRYGQPLLFAVGDGNHSLAAAKACYENAKREGRDTRLSRYALVEAENLYADGLKFEPIHRLVLGADADELYADYLQAARGKEFTDSTRFYGENGRVIGSVPMPSGAIDGVKFVQEFLDGYAARKACKIDYIHGLKDLQKLASAGRNTGIELKAMAKSELFAYIVKEGVLPRKTFSMGEAEEKRYYVEARRIR